MEDFDDDGVPVRAHPSAHVRRGKALVALTELLGRQEPLVAKLSPEALRALRELGEDRDG